MSSARGEKRRRDQRRKKRLRLESLETRRLLATLTVNTTDDAVDLNPGDGVCEISAGGACSLRAAIQEANALTNVDGPDQIVVPAGNYVLTISGTDDQQSRSGDLDFSDAAILQGAGSGSTVIDGGGRDRVIDVVRSSLTINGVTVRGGLIGVDDDPVEGSGGGIRNEGELTINDSLITGNVAPFGAGVSNYNATVRIRSSVITGNGDVTTTRGGGIANYANYDPASIEVTDTTISANQANTGGGISSRSYDAVVSTTIVRSTLSGNTATTGGAIANQSVYYYADSVAANLTIRNSTVSGNTAGASGAGIHNEASPQSNASATIDNSTVANNSTTAGDGGGIRNAASSGAAVTLRSTIIAGNTASGLGNDLSSDQTTASFSLLQSTDGHGVVDGVNNNLVGDDPQLGELTDNGGQVETHSLSATSPAIDQGSNGQSLASDQRGSAFARTIDNVNIDNAADGTDIGAVEIGQQAATLDFGDAPESITVGGQLRRYPTRLASDGARHVVSNGGPKLGTVTPDAEPDGQTNSSAGGDDAGGLDDEDAFGNQSLVFTPGESLAGFSIAHDGGATGALLSAWIDLNLDGDWNDFGEQILTDVAVPAGVASTSLENVTLASTTPSGTTFIRVRLSTQAGLTPRGEAPDGEVEDFLATIGAPPPQVADLSLTQAVSNPNPELGEDVTFTIALSNDGPDQATNIEVTDFLPFELIFDRSAVTQGEYDDLDGIWFVGNLPAGQTATLTITATVDSSDTITNTAEVTAVDQSDPDSRPGNGVSGEDDQFALSIGTCLTASPLVEGMNQVSFSCASPGTFTALVRGSQRGTTTFDDYGVTVDIADAEVVAIVIADSNGIASGVMEISADELDDFILVQAFQMTLGRQKSNTVQLEADSEMLVTPQMGFGGEVISRDSLDDVVESAIAYWAGTGISDEAVARLQRARVHVADLPGRAIGRALGTTIVIDHDAAGHGWFIDATPNANEEYNSTSLPLLFEASQPTSQAHVDALTVLIHEFGHLLNLPHGDAANDVMNDELSPGIRRVPDSNHAQQVPLDVTGDLRVTARDALVVINLLGRLSLAGGDSDLIEDLIATFDVNQDGRVSALDALTIINHLGREPVPQAEQVSVMAPEAIDKVVNDVWLDPDFDLTHQLS